MSRISATVITVVALVVITLGGAPVTAQSSATCGPLNNGRVADVVYKDNAVFFAPTVRYEYVRAVLTISGPCEDIVRSFKPGEQIFFDLGEVRRTLNGTYTWQLRFTPVIDPAVQENLQAARGSGEEADLWWYYWQKGAIPADASVDSASFSVVDGVIIDPASGVESQKSATVATRSSAGHLDSAALAAVPAAALGAADIGGTGGGGSGGATLAPKDFVINDDLIVDGSACIGFDCVNGESFGFDTIRLKENNLRIKFDDTSTAASFPRNDWQITANDSANGGKSKFSIDDISGSRTPFTIEANAPSHSLYVDDGGRLGLGTSTPSVEIHTIDGDTPTLRLQQDGSSGFAPQTWDVAGNETNFFIRDVTNGSQLPFRIRPDAPTSSIFIDVDGDVGLKTSSPEERLHIVGSNNPRLLIEDTTDDANDKPGLALRSPAAASAGDWRFEVDNAGNFQIDFGPSAGPELIISDATATNGTVTIPGPLIVSGGCTGCDKVFQPDFELESIEDHAVSMFKESYLPAVGPTPEGQVQINVFEKTTGILQELEKAHIYIAQLNERLTERDSRVAEFEEQNSALLDRQEQLEQELASLKQLVERFAGETPADH